MVDPDVQQVWEEFWKPFVVKNNGSLDLDQIKKELFDFHTLMHIAATVLESHPLIRP
jgi:hypothetical protein